MRTPPRLIARTLAVTLVTVTVMLSVVFIVLTIETRDRVRAAETSKLDATEKVFSQEEAARQGDQLTMLTALAEHPRIKAAIDTYFSEMSFGGVPPDQEQSLRQTVRRQLDDLARAIDADTLALLDANGRVFLASGDARDHWPVGQPVEMFQNVAVLPGGEAFRVTAAPLRLAGDRDIGTLVLATSLDANYAQQLSNLAGAGVVIALGDRVLARTVSDEAARALVTAGAELGPMQMLDDDEYAIQPLFSAGPVRIYSLSSIDNAASGPTRDALEALGAIAMGSFLLATLGSLWLARALTNPIDTLSRDIATMSAAREYGRMLQPTGSSREIDGLATAFNDLMQGLTNAERDTRAAYVGAIRALAAALDARDPYTAGHSERVSAYSVLIARELKLAEADVDVIRLGALLHDIGKIGVADEVLRKPGPLSASEFEQIKRHPALGARILRQVPFLAPHLPIVELHHERPDGKGYPFGLRADDIPVAARIVHVADALDAMTSVRAYRPSRGTSFALEELQRCSGSEFDPACVDAICAALPTASPLLEPQLQELLGRGV